MATHVVIVSQIRFDVGVAAMLSYSVLLHVERGEQTRSVVRVGAAASNSVSGKMQAVINEQVRSDVAVAATDSYS